MAPHLLKLEPLWLEQGVDKVENVQADATAIDPSEYITDLIHPHIDIQFDVGNLVFLTDIFEKLTKNFRINSMLG